MATVDDNFQVATEAHDIAARLIYDHHTHLDRANILMLFTDKPRQHKQRAVLGSSRRLSALQRYLAGRADPASVPPDFLIVLDRSAWGELDDNQREALVDHELCHCWITAKGAYTIRGHDVEEFREVIERHGLWKSDVRDFAHAAVHQLALFAQADAANAQAGDEPHDDAA